MATLALEGRRPLRCWSAWARPVPEADYATRTWADGSLRASVQLAGRRLLYLLLPSGKKGALIAALEAEGIAEATPDDARTVRIEHGRPRLRRRNH